MSRRSSGSPSTTSTTCPIAVPVLPVLGARPGPPRPASPSDAAAEKEAWVSQVLLEWGSCGRVALRRRRAGGLRCSTRREAFLPGAGAFPTAPVSRTRCC